MQWSRKRWLAVLAVLAGLGAILATVAQAGGSPRAQAAKKSLCSGGPSTVTVRAKTAANKIYVICETRRGPTGPPGNTGPPGPAGPAGPQGPGGQSVSQALVTIHRTAVPFSDCCMFDGGNIQPLAQIGPIHIDGLCRHTVAGPGGSGPGSGKVAEFPDPNFPTQTGESEAKVIVWTETGTLSYKGQVGHRENVPPGPPDYTHEQGNIEGSNEPGPANGTVDDPVAGEGQHMFAAASNEEVDQIRGTDPATNPGHENDPGIHQLPEYPYMQYAGGVIGTSDGHLVLANMLAGFDVLGVYGECVFAGVIRPIS